MIMMVFQVGAGENYVMTVGGFNSALSTLGDSMTYSNGMKFSTRFVPYTKITKIKKKAKKRFILD